MLEAAFLAQVWGDLTVNPPRQKTRGNFDEVDPGTRPGWQQESSLMLEERFVCDSLWPRLTPQGKALFHSQGGPMKVCHTPASRSLLTAGFDTAFQGVAPPSCELHAICRRVQDMDLARPDSLDNRRLEIVADGLPLPLPGAQLAVWTSRSCQPSDVTRFLTRAANHNGAVLDAACRRRERICPELTGWFGRTRLVVAVEVAGRRKP